MELNELLDGASICGLTIRTDNTRLVVGGPRNAKTFAQSILAQKSDVMDALIEGRRLVNLLQARGHRILAMNNYRLRVIPQMPPDLKQTLMAQKSAILHIVRAQLPGGEQMSSSEDDNNQLSSEPKEPWPPKVEYPIGWEQEYRIELATLRHRIRLCDNHRVRLYLQENARAQPPMNEKEWIELGCRWRDAEILLQKLKLLPTCLPRE